MPVVHSVCSIYSSFFYYIFRITWTKNVLSKAKYRTSCDWEMRRMYHVSMWYIIMCSRLFVKKRNASVDPLWFMGIRSITITIPRLIATSLLCIEELVSSSHRKSFKFNTALLMRVLARHSPSPYKWVLYETHLGHSSLLHLFTVCSSVTLLATLLRHRRRYSSLLRVLLCCFSSSFFFLLLMDEKHNFYLLFI